VKDRESIGGLSNAAAAAALRTHVTTPVPVGDTITKRMVRRGSASSNGSGAQRPAGLQRQSSSGSMAERTFRSPSPGRASPAGSNAPPVPAIPKNVPQQAFVHRRASSLEPALRGGSPGPRGGGRGVSLDRGTGNTTSARGQRAPSNLSQVPEDDMDANQRASVNFSRPMSPASAAQYASPSAKGWFGGPIVDQDAVRNIAAGSRPRTSSGVASYDTRNTYQQTQGRMRQISRGAESSRMSVGSMRAKPSVESRSFLQAQGPVDPKSPDAVFDPSTRTFIRKQDAMARHRELHQEPEQPAHRYIAQHVEEYRPHPAPQQQRALRTPSPVRQPMRTMSPPVQRREDVALPKLDTSPRTRHPEDSPTGIPAPRDDDSAVSERQQSQRFADAPVQPTEQANTGRKLEGTAQPVPIDVTISPQFNPTQDSSYPRLSAPATPTPTTTARLTPAQLRESDRGHSLSPPRYAHFAPNAVELAGMKHQPPPRSISPAKSALKSSQSFSRGNSPVASNGRLHSKAASSEASEAPSDAGSTRKKRDVRVSFEEAPVIAGTSAYPDAASPIVPAGLGASRWSANAGKEAEFDDFMKPRPALPTFGSVRNKEKEPTQHDEAQKVSDTVTSTPMSASVGSIGEPLHASNDHVVGGILAQEHSRKQSAHSDPLPPEVTSVEGSGYVSDSSDEAVRSVNTQKHGALDDSSQILPVPEPKSLTAPHEGKLLSPVSEPVEDVPQIALLPATPSPFEHPEPKYQSMVIPGGWDDDVEVEAEAPPQIAAVIPSAFEPTPFAPIQQPRTLQHLIEQDHESSDDNSSVYSDAYEDLEESGGFGSINAIIDSPIVPSSSGLLSSKYANTDATDSSSGVRNGQIAEDVPEPVTTPLEGWDAARQHWSGVSESLKQPQPERSVAQLSDAMQFTTHATEQPVKQESSMTNRAVESKLYKSKGSRPQQTQPEVSQSSTKPLKSALKKPAAVQPAPAAEPQSRKTMRGPPAREERAEPQIRKTMRGPPPRDTRSAEPQMRSTMRAGANPSPRAEPQMRTSMRGNDANSNTGLAVSRHSMTPVDTKPLRGALQKKNIPPAVAASKSRPQSVPATIARPGAIIPTYDSDSDGSASSFQRSRARGRNGGGRTMRSSMRQDATATMRTNAPAPAPVRSISPPRSAAPAIRKSMRPSSPNPEAPRSSKFSIRSLSPMGRFRNSKAFEPTPPSPTQPKKAQGFSKQSKTKAPVAERARPAFKSRITDSSDEDQDRKPSRFQSRFADSDSDDPGDYKLPPGLAPVRGIPKKHGEEDGDSTDLEEEADEVPVSSSAAPVTNGATNGQTNGQGAILAVGSLRDSKHAPLPAFEGGGKAKTKRGFFGLGKKKAGAAPPQSQPVIEASSVAARPSTAPASDVPPPPQQRNRDVGLPLTPIDEDRGDFGSPVAASPQSKKAPKLQRRSTPEWPLPPVPSIAGDERPMSSDGIVPRRPRFAMRQSSILSNATAPPADGVTRSVSYGRTGKKKKFQGLRRVFGLND
jgi:serine/arginine repetitive matrix protein 2